MSRCRVVITLRLALTHIARSRLSPACHSPNRRYDRLFSVVRSTSGARRPPPYPGTSTVLNSRCRSAQAAPIESPSVCQVGDRRRSTGIRHGQSGVAPVASGDAPPLNYRAEMVGSTVVRTRQETGSGARHGAGTETLSLRFLTPLRGRWSRSDRSWWGSTPRGGRLPSSAITASGPTP